MRPRNARAWFALLEAALEAGTSVPAESLRGYAEAYLALERRMDKVSRISDAYQAERLELNQGLVETNQQLSQALSEVKTLRGFIPICSKCKRIRDDQGYWDQVESYISRHSDAIFSHGVCPDCAEDLRGELRTRTGKPHRRIRETDRVWLERVQELLERPEHRANPLAPELEALARHHERLLARFEKIARISDGFQAQLKGLNQALAEASMMDALTRLPNRRSMMDRLKSEMARSDREGTVLTLIMADVDLFKEVNDRHGHEAGDLTLVSLGEVFRSVLREYDSCARWGGEEFLFLLPATSKEDGLAVVQRLQQKLAETVITTEAASWQITLSFGIAQRGAGESQNALLVRADTALYQAKHQGRNRVEVAE